MRSTLDPACAVACVRLLSDPEQSPLLNSAQPADELRSRVSQIRSGFAASDLAPAASSKTIRSGLGGGRMALRHSPCGETTDSVSARFPIRGSLRSRA